MGTSVTHAENQAMFRELRGHPPDSGAWLVLRNRIVERNMGLVRYMMNGRHVGARDWDATFSKALGALMRAVRGFDASLGFRFNTYACKAIAFEIVREREVEKKHMGRFVTGYGKWLGKAKNVDVSANLVAEDVRRKLADDATGLTERESMILAARFPMNGGERMTLRAVGLLLSIGKERVRQIQVVALRKLRGVLEAA